MHNTKRLIRKPLTNLPFPQKSKLTTAVGKIWEVRIKGFVDDKKGLLIK